MRRHHVPRLAGLASALALSLAGLAHAQEEKKGPPFADGPGASGEKSGPPFADGPDTPKVPPRPESRTWTVVEGKFTFTFAFEPGIPKKGELLEVIVSGVEQPDTPDPRWGSTVPLVNAKIVAEHSSPAGELIARYLLHPKPLAQGKYGLHLTPLEEGVQALKLVATLADGREVSAKVELPVDVWPLPERLEGTGDAGGSSRRRAIRRPVSK